MSGCRSRYDEVTGKWRFEIANYETGLFEYVSLWRYSSEEDAEQAGDDAMAYALKSIEEAIKEREVKQEISRITGGQDGNTKRGTDQQSR